MDLKRYFFLAALMVILSVALAASRPAANASPRVVPKTETAILAGGCFWGLQENFRHLPGVIKTTVGYTGGTLPNPTYQQVCSHTTGHAEAIQIIFDPAQLTYEHLLDNFFRSHNPTTADPQRNNLKTSYRSAIFYISDDQRRIAEQVTVNQSGKRQRPVSTEITQATAFYPAEDYHQDYYQKHGGGLKCPTPPATP